IALLPPTHTPLEAMLGLDVLVSCSRIAEPFGFSVVEAMSLGKPVIAAAEGGPAELITHAESGWLFRPRDEHDLADALARVASSPEERARVGVRARAAMEARGDAALGVRLLEDFYDRL